MSGAVRSHSHCEIARYVMPRYSASCSCVISFSRRKRLIVEPTDIFCPPKSIQKRFCDFIISDFKKTFHEVFVDKKYSVTLFFKDIISQTNKYIKLYFCLPGALRPGLGQA